MVVVGMRKAKKNLDCLGQSLQLCDDTQRVGFLQRARTAFALPDKDLALPGNSPQQAVHAGPRSVIRAGRGGVGGYLALGSRRLPITRRPDGVPHRAPVFQQPDRDRSLGEPGHNPGGRRIPAATQT
jgi:hypothetical protein